MILKNSVAVIILAGGHSSRMKQPKPWLKLENNKSFIEELVSTYKMTGISNITVILNAEFSKKEWTVAYQNLNNKVKVLLNSEVDKGRVFSLQKGLAETKETDYVFIQNIDNPTIDHNTLISLLKKRNKNGVTQPVFLEKKGHPIIITNKIVNELLNANYKNSTLRELLNKYSKIEVPIDDESVLLNINTYPKYLALKNELI